MHTNIIYIQPIPSIHISTSTYSWEWIGKLLSCFQHNLQLIGHFTPTQYEYNQPLVVAISPVFGSDVVRKPDPCAVTKKILI